MRSPKPRARVRAPAENARPDSRVRTRRLECAPRSSSRRSSRVRTALKTLRRLRGGWRPPESLLADARQAGHGAMARQTGAAVYQARFPAGQQLLDDRRPARAPSHRALGAAVRRPVDQARRAVGRDAAGRHAEIMALAEQ